MTPATIRAMKNILKASVDSSRNIIPNTITPTAPMAVQQAYAVPIGIVLKEIDKKTKLKIMKIRKVQYKIDLKSYLRI